MKGLNQLLLAILSEEETEQYIKEKVELDRKLDTLEKIKEERAHKFTADYEQCKYTTNSAIGLIEDFNEFEKEYYIVTDQLKNNFIAKWTVI
jgi:hypothetical protein